MTDSLTGVGASLEAPTMVASGGKSPVMAIIEQLSASQCIMRSVNQFELGAAVEFNAVVHGAAPVALHGTISTRMQSGPRYKYTITLQSSPTETAAIEHLVDVARTRAGRHQADAQAPSHLMRTSVRVPVDFPVRFKMEGGSTYDARATNISTGGILMNTAEQLAVGASLELHFLLDDVAVSIHGRIVAHQESTPNYNIAFFDIRDMVKETLARFVANASV